MLFIQDTDICKQTIDFYPGYMFPLTDDNKQLYGYPFP